MLSIIYLTLGSVRQVCFSHSHRVPRHTIKLLLAATPEYVKLKTPIAEVLFFMRILNAEQEII